MNQLKELDRQIYAVERELAQIQRINPIAKLLSSTPGVGPITATALAATVPDPTMFRADREFAAWLGLTPKQHPTDGKDRLGRITKQGDSYLRHLLVIGARNVVGFPVRSRVGGGWIEALPAAMAPEASARGRVKSPGRASIGGRRGTSKGAQRRRPMVVRYRRCQPVGSDQLGDDDDWRVLSAYAGGLSRVPGQVLV